jgi:ABC-type sugar transport system ATPase subunit
MTHGRSKPALADRVVVLNAQAKIQQVGTPNRSLRHAHANTFVASFIRIPAMNLIEGTLTNGVFEGQHPRRGLPGGRSGNIARWVPAPKTRKSSQTAARLRHRCLLHRGVEAKSMITWRM